MSISAVTAHVQKHALRWLYGVGAIIFISAGWFWWYRVQTNPERVFWDTMSQSLSTSGVTMQATQDSDGSKVAHTLQYSLGGINRARSLTALEQGTTKVTTEIIGTPDTDYTRYTRIDTDQKDSAGKSFDLKGVLGVWAKGDKGANQLLGQGLLGLGLPLGALPVPIGNLTPEARGKILNQMRSEEVYKTSFDKVKREHKKGRLTYTYDVSIQMILYAHLMRSFASSVGLDELKDLDPNTYQGAAPIEVQLTIDVRSHHIVSVHVPETGYKQYYSAYDVPVSAAIPARTIPASELQKRLSELQ